MLTPNDWLAALLMKLSVCYYFRLRPRRAVLQFHAGVAQLVEQLICNHQVGGSSPFTGSSIHGRFSLAMDIPTSIPT